MTPGVELRFNIERPGKCEASRPLASAFLPALCTSLVNER
jgi:hypothetical protein